MKAHESDYMASRFTPHEFTLRGTTVPVEGVYAGDVIPPKVLVPDLYTTCTYCGSLTIDDFLDALEKRAPGTHYSGSDWKYGWPHKFYIDIPCEPYRTYSGGRSSATEQLVEWTIRNTRNHKFYADHMIDATPVQLERWDRVAFPLLGVRYSVRAEDGALGYAASYRGVQMSGTFM